MKLVPAVVPALPVSHQKLVDAEMSDHVDIHLALPDASDARMKLLDAHEDIRIP